MERFNRPDEGFTLIELIIAAALAAVVLLAGSNLLVNFGRFSARAVRNESSLMTTSLGSLEEVVNWISAANQVAINGTDAALSSAGWPAGCAGSSCIQVRVDRTTPITPSVIADDTVFTYWQSGANLNSTTKIGAGAVSGVRVLAEDIEALSFVRDVSNPNRIVLTLDAHTHSGNAASATNITREHLVTTAIMRSRGAAQP